LSQISDNIGDGSIPSSTHGLLARLGLNELEISVYLALLTVKVAKATVVARLTKLSRSNTYLILRSLIEKGLVSEIDRGKVLHFVAEDPTRLISYAQNKENEMQQVQTLLHSTVPFLKALSPALIGQPRVTFSHGLEGMKAIYRDVLKHDFSSLFNPEAMYRTYGANLAATLPTKYQKLRGRDLLVDNDAAKRYVTEIDPEEDAYECRILPKDTVFHTDTLIFGDTVALFAYDSELTIIRIENRALAQAFLAWFDLMWKAGKPARVLRSKKK